jgi:hypothetical protein
MFLYCLKCERAFISSVGTYHVLCDEKYFLDWFDFAFRMGYPFFPDLSKKYSVFHLDLYKRVESGRLDDLKRYSPGTYVLAFEQWKKGHLRRFNIPKSTALIAGLFNFG